MGTKRTRGSGKKPSLVHISVRISKEADRFYASTPNKSEYIRRVLQEHYEEAQQEIRYALDNPEYLRERFEEVKKRLTPQVDV